MGNRHFQKLFVPLPDRASGRVGAAAAAPGTGITETPTRYDRQQERRHTTRRIVRKLELEWQGSDIHSVLGNRVSFQKWDEITRDANFESREDRQARYEANPPRARSHVPLQPEKRWDTQGVLDEARSWPEGTPVVWSRLAARHGVQGGNAGQQVKEFLRAEGIDVNAMERRTTPRAPVQRSCRKRLQDGRAFPVHRRGERIRLDLQENIDNGTFQVGFPSHRHVVYRYHLSNGEVHIKEIEVYGRQFPLTEIRERLLRQHENAGFMRSASNYEAMTHAEALSRLGDIGELSNGDDELPVARLVERVKQFERSRQLLLGHDHSAMLGRGWLYEVVQVVYDPAVHLTDEEFFRAHKRHVDVQAEVERPALHLLIMCGADDESELRSTRERVDDIHCVEHPIARGDQVLVRDRLVGFKGDLPAGWHEAGLQKGGTFKYRSGCGIPAKDFPSFARNTEGTPPSLANLQQRAVAGRYARSMQSHQPEHGTTTP